MKKIFFTFKIFTILLISFLAFNNSFAIVVDTGQTVTVNSDLTVSTIRVHSGGTLIINLGVEVTIEEDLSGFNELELYSGGTITGAGLLKTNCADEHDIIMAIWENSIFDVDFESVSGRAVFISAGNYILIHKKITIDTGASMVYFGTSGLSRLTVRGNIINNGNLGSSSGLIIFKGQTITNNDTINADIEIDTNCIIYGNGAWTSVYLFINPYRTLSLGNNVSTSIRNIILQSNAKLNLNSYTITLLDYTQTSYTDILMYESSILSSGIVKTKGYTVRFNIDTTAKLYAPLLVDSGNALMGGLFGSRTIFDSSVTINNNASFNSSGYEIIFKNDVTNNGYLVLSYCKFRGGNLVNNGNICGGLVDFESNFNFSGSGLWTCQSFLYVKPNKTVTLQGDVRIAIDVFEIETDATLNTNGHSFILDHLDGSSGDLNVDSAATITGSGEVLAKGHPEISFSHVDIFNHANSNFNVALRVTSGLLFLEDPSSLNGKTVINNLITVDSGATLANQSSGDTIIANDSIVNNGTLSGIYNLYGSSFVNNGIVTSAFFIFSYPPITAATSQTFQGTGSFEHPSYCIIDNGATVNLNSEHQLFILQIDSGGTFNISNQTLKISGVTTEPITNNGSFVTTGSTVEFNGGSQYFPVTNINYNNVRINNSSGLTLTGNVTLPALLTLSNGDLDLNGFIITLTPSATLIETSGNTVKGNNGSVTTTRNLNAPSNLNVAGMGAVLTASANLGATEIRRSHSPVIILGNESVERHFDIIPTNNTNLNATLGFKYDYSELDTLQESELGLFKSTNSGMNYSYVGGTVDTANNQINVSGINKFSRWSASLSAVAVAANITLIIEGLLDVNTLQLNSRDTVTAYLANSSSPFNFIDSAKSVIDSVNYTGAFLFSNAPSGIYYIVIKHRNGIETWSKSGGEEYNVGKVLNYNFTGAQTQAYGDNLKLKSGLWCIYSGDVNNDGAIDLADLGVIDNDSYNFVGGYVNSDLNRDGIVDLADMTIADNNALNFVSVVRP